MAEGFTGLNAELKRADFYCASGSACPSNVGLMYFNLDGATSTPKIGQCTGFMIADDIVATNSHCIPDRLKVPGASCESQIAIRFIGRPGEKQVFDCKQILEFSPLGIFDPDYAFFKVASTGITPWVLHKDGLKDNQEVSIAKVTPLSHTAGGRLEVQNCKVGLGSLLNVKGVTSWSKTAVALGCEAIGGNSGSPVVNLNGEVIGVMQSKMLSGYARLVEASFKQFKLSVPSYMSPHTLFTSLSCVKDPVAGHPNEEKCKAVEDLNLIDCANLDSEKTQENSRQMGARWKSALPSLFVYEYSTEEGSFMYSAYPVCVKPQEKSSDYKHFVELKGILGFRKEHLNAVYPYSIMIGARLSVDDDYRLVPEIRFVEELRTQYSINLVKRDDTWKGTTRSTYSDSILNVDFTRIKIPMSLKDCTQAQLDAKEISKVKLKTGETISEEEYKARLKKTDKKVCEK